ncbi:hypothetical protein K227x_54120 [Rubripirellula lacrimiformis]|uniref:LTXXQ motif protein n=1 Tax=Rubripirellula lacrimiformis TaxID=1930273 RepID=A0A517NIR5_9BACT|nr:hypothetical protein [Rubripirellula lacrimiformis]QDT06988.1 hypothetical protein K227x_54120 [Rubripirellula lacrimiformis]
MKFSSRTFRLFALLLVSAGMTATAAFAQDNNRRGGGRGGMGGGRPGGGDPTLGLLRVDQVREELKLSTDQVGALDKLSEQMRPERPEGVDFRSMTEDQRNEFFAKVRKDAEEKTKEMKEKLEEVLFPEQIERLGEIALQVQGSQALESPEVVKELTITETQKKKLAEVRESLGQEMQAKVREMFSNRDRNPNMREEFAKLRSEMDDKIFAVLTSDQRSKFEKMKGDKFEMPEGAMGFGGPGGGRGAAGGDRGGRGGAGGERGRGGPGGNRGRGGDRGQGGSDQ